MLQLSITLEQAYEACRMVIDCADPTLSDDELRIRRDAVLDAFACMEQKAMNEACKQETH